MLLLSGEACAASADLSLESREKLAQVLDAAKEHRQLQTIIISHGGKVLAERHGVCQDFARFAIACLRSHGLAARYVSGYLETLPAPGAPRLAGVDASHAWLAVWVGAAAGRLAACAVAGRAAAGKSKGIPARCVRCA